MTREEANRDMEEIKEIMEYDADIETKYKMIYNILTAKPHCFEKQEPSEDCISRKAVLENAKSYHTDGDMYTPLVVDAEDIEDLPSVTPELSSLREMNDALKKRVEFLENMIRYASAPTKKVGKWEYDPYKDKSGGHCNQCGHFLRYGEKTNFCPDCGTEMEVE